MLICEMPLLQIVVLIFVLSDTQCDVTVSWPNNVNVAIVHNSLAVDAIRMTLKYAEEELKNNHIISQTVNFTIYSGYGCDDISTVSVVVNYIEKYRPDVFLGPQCSTGMPAGGLITAHYNIPTIGYSSIASELSDKKVYSTLARISFPMGPLGQAVKIMLNLHNWRRVAIVRSQNIACTTSLSGIYDVLNREQFELRGEFFADTPTEIADALNRVKKVARIIIVCFEYMPSTALDFLVQAYKMGMVNSEFVYITACFSLRKIVSWKPWMNMNLNDTEAINLAKQAFRNVLVVEATGTEINSILNYKTRLVDFSKKKGINISSQMTDADIYLTPRIHDALYLYGLALNSSVQNGEYYKNGRLMFNKMKGIQYEGVSGKVVMNDQVERLPDYWVYTFDEKNDMSPIYSVFVEFSRSNFSYKYTQLRSPFWNTSDGTAPPDTPVCGFTGEHCQMASTSYLTIILGLLAVVCLTVFIGTAYYKKQKREQDVLKMRWKVNLNELHFLSTKISQRSFLSITSLNETEPTVSVNQTNKAVFQGELIYVKRYKRSSIYSLTKQQLIELNNLRDVHYDNLNRFFGANFDDDPNYLLFLWRFCDKGSLMEIIYNYDIQLDMMIKTCLISDVTSGLEYLHKSSIGFHGSLNCNNCVVNSRWTVKLTDFGLDNLLTSLKRNSVIAVEENDNYYNKLHIAPERNSNVHLEADNARCADVFSFSIIMYQVLFRSEPIFEDEHLKSTRPFYIPKLTFY